jgi:autotransporter-associated beta strand protein
LTISGLNGATNGRIGFRYYLPNNNTDGTIIGIDTFSFADPTVFSRTVSGNWTDTTGWTPSSVPNGNTVTAQLVNPGSGTNSVNLGGGTFTVNQLQFSGTNAGTWNVTNGTIIFDGTNPTFLNQGDSSGLVGSLPNLQLNATTTFEIDNASAVTNVTGTISGTGALLKQGSGPLTLTGANTYTGGTNLNGGVLAVNSDGNLGSGALSFNGGTLEALAAGGGITSTKAITLNALGGTFLADAGTTSTLSGAISGVGSLTKDGAGTTIFTGANTYGGGTNLNAGVLVVNNDRNLGSGALSFNGGTLEALAAGGITSSKAITLNALGGTFLADAGTSSTVSGVMSGVGAFGAAQGIVLLEAVQGSFAEFASIFGGTPNAVAVGKALDSAVGDPRAAELIGVLNNQSLTDLSEDLVLISPEQLTSIFVLGVSLANVQSANLERRMEDIRAGSSGFSSAGFAINGSGPSFWEGFSGVSGPEGKSDPAVFAPVPQNRWGVFATGLGEFTNVDSTFNRAATIWPQAALPWALIIGSDRTLRSA